MRRSLLLLSCLVMSFAGCVDDTAVPADPDLAEAGPDAPRGPVREADPSSSAAAPDWRPGHWWRWKAVPRDAAEYEATTIVAAADPDGYQIGWGSIDGGLRSQFFHFIPNGAVARADLSWEAHHDSVSWFDFPLEDGKTWTGGIWMTDMAFTATAGTVTSPGGPTDGFHVEGSGADGGVRVVYEWSTAAAIFTRLDFYLFDETPWLSLTLLEDGQAYGDAVHLLHGEMAFARFTSLEQALGTTTPPPLAETITIPDGVTHAALGCYLGGAPGYHGYRLTDSTQGGVGCAVQTTDTWFGMLLDQGPVTPGDAVSGFVTAGQGSVFAELFLVRVETVTLG